MKPDVCPQCGAEIPARAKACAECGSCEDTGWSEQAESQRLNLPDDEFDYDAFARREFEGQVPARRNQHLWQAVVIGLLLLALLGWLL